MKAKVNALSERIKMIQMELEYKCDPQGKNKPWNPANNIFVKCTGCGEQGLCSTC